MPPCAALNWLLGLYTALHSSPDFFACLKSDPYEKCQTIMQGTVEKKHVLGTPKNLRASREWRLKLLV